MNSKNSRLIRPIGQRSITSSFLFRASNRNGARNEETKAPSRKGSSGLSLSDFLNRKLHKSSVLPTSSVQGEEMAVSPLMGEEHSDIVADAENVKTGGQEADEKFSIEGAFCMFKNVAKNNNGSKNSCSTNAPEIIYVDDIKQTRKRKNLNEGYVDKPSAGKRLAVLGEDSKPVQRSRRKKVVDDEPRPLFNHYGNGGGWWNDNMEGVDNEEVGCSDAWEGVGCTALGGIEWH